jgi:hypothetical protein
MPYMKFVKIAAIVLLTATGIILISHLGYGDYEQAKATREYWPY